MTDPTSDAGYRLIPAQRVTLLLRIRDHVKRHSLMIELMRRARDAHLAGATAFRAAEGYGQSGRVHRSHAFQEDVPVSVVIVDTADRVSGFLAANEDLVGDVLVAVDDVEIVRFHSVATPDEE